MTAADPREVRATSRRWGVSVLGDWAAQLQSALEGFGNRNATVPYDSRLHASLDLLKECAAANRMPDDSIADGRVVNAIANARDFAEIERNLPSTLTRETINELRQSYDGTLLQQEPDDQRKPYQMQSSLWIGAVLRLGGLNPQVAQISKSSPVSAPDYLVENGTHHYGVEVKRPTGWDALERTHLDKAESQLTAFGVEGAVVIDMSDMLRDNFADYEAEFIATLRRLEKTIVTKQSAVEPRYRRFMIGFAYARNVFTLSAAGSLLTVNAVAGYEQFAGQAKTLRRWHAQWLGDLIARGMGKAGSVEHWEPVGAF